MLAERDSAFDLRARLTRELYLDSPPGAADGGGCGIMPVGGAPVEPSEMSNSSLMNIRWANHRLAGRITASSRAHRDEVRQQRSLFREGRLLFVSDRLQTLEPWWAVTRWALCRTCARSAHQPSTTVVFRVPSAQHIIEDLLQPPPCRTPAE